MRVFSVYDSKAEAYGAPVFFKTKGEAIRGFTDIVNDGNSMLSKYPGDYTLFELGSFDEETAKFDLHASPVSLGVALEFVKSLS